MGFRSTGYREKTGFASPTQATAATKRELSEAAGRTGMRHSDKNHRLPHRSLFHKLIVATGEYFMHQPKPRVLLLGLLMVTAIGELDFFSGPDLSLSLFYLLPITFVTWRIGRTAGFALSLLSV